jgi:hypothetical protein
MQLLITSLYELVHQYLSTTTACGYNTQHGTKKNGFLKITRSYEIRKTKREIKVTFFGFNWSPFVIIPFKLLKDVYFLEFTFILKLF